MLRRLSIPRVPGLSIWPPTYSLHLPLSLSLYLPLSHCGASLLESIRTIRIISRISGRTNVLPVHLWQHSSSRRYCNAKQPSMFGHCCFKHSTNPFWKKRTGKNLFFFFRVYMTEYNRLSQKSHIFSLLTLPLFFDILLLDKVPTSKTICKGREKNSNVAYNVV